MCAHEQMCVWTPVQHHEAAVIECGNILCVHTKGTHLSLEGINDEVQGVWLDTLDTLLHHVVTVLVLHTLQHMAVQFPHHLALQWRRREERERGRGSRAEREGATVK